VKIQTKITILLTAFSVCVILAAGIFSTLSLKTYFHNRLITELGTQIDQIEYLLRNSNQTKIDTYEYIRQYAHTSKLRLTLISNDGRVIFESELPEEKLPGIENHLYRKEIQDALNKGIGTDTRKSTTLNIDMLYTSKSLPIPLPDSSRFRNAKFIRIGVPLTHVQETTSDIRNKVVFASIIALVIITILGLYISRKISRPLQEMGKIATEVQEGNIDKRIPVRSSDEIGKLTETLNAMLDKLHEDIAKLKKLETIRSEFLGNVSHELRTPIFAVQGMLETLLAGALDDPEARKDFVQRALANTQRLNALLNDLIEISRIESGDMKMSFRYFPVHEFLSQVVSEMKPLAEQKNCFLETLSAHSGIDAYGDRERLKQALINLVDNAIKYNKPDGKVRIISEVVGQQVKISVQDTGIGIEPEHISRIFERFYRIDKERSREAGGT
jgi:two-component system phosphate regulon sensor histidine kinase PhoR